VPRFGSINRRKAESSWEEPPNRLKTLYFHKLPAKIGFSREPLLSSRASGHHVPAHSGVGRQEESEHLSISKLFALVPVCVLAVACGGGATPEAAAPEGAAAAEQKPAEAAAPAADAPAAEAPAAAPAAAEKK